MWISQVSVYSTQGVRCEIGVEYTCHGRSPVYFGICRVHDICFYYWIKFYSLTLANLCLNSIVENIQEDCDYTSFFRKPHTIDLDLDDSIRVDRAMVQSLVSPCT